MEILYKKLCLLEFFIDYVKSFYSLLHNIKNLQILYKKYVILISIKTIIYVIYVK